MWCTWGDRPSGNENSTISLFKLSADGQYAVRVPVKVGRASVNSVQVLEGLQPGDVVILSDMSPMGWAGQVADQQGFL